MEDARFVLSARHTPLIKLTFGKGTMNDANACRLKDIVVPITRDHSLVVGGVVKSSNRSISSAGTPLEEKPILDAMCIRRR